MANDDLAFMDDDLDDIPDRDLNRLRDLHSKAGYRDGVSDGQESMLQAGFNNGFLEATNKYRQSSKLRGSISAMMIFFNENQFGSKKLLKDLEDILNELKGIEEKQPELDETMADSISRPKTNKLAKDMKAEAANTKDIEILVDSCSIREDNNSTSEGHATKHSDIHRDNFEKMDNDNDVVDSCCSQGNNCHQMQVNQKKCEKRLNLKYSFTVEDKLQQLEELLRSHQVSSSFVDNLRSSILSIK